MSARSDDALRAASALAVALVLAACGGTAAVRPSPEQASEAEATPASEAEATPAPEAAAPASGRRRATASEPDLPVPDDAAQAYARGLAAMAGERWIEAELELEQLVLEHDEFAGPYVNLAIVYMHGGRDEDALAALEQALAIEPTHAPASNQLGILLRRQGKFSEAEAAYRRAIEADAGYALAHYNLGVLLDLYLRRPTEALAQYEHYQGLLAEPDPQVGRWIIDLRRRLGVTDDASRVAREEGP